jgi:ribonuclease P protein component
MTGPLTALRRNTYPKSRRLLKTREYREVYDRGVRISGPCFVAFCLRSESAEGPRLGFTTTRALGKSTARNRMKRRVRETFRRRLQGVDPHWRIVVNVRRAALDAQQSTLDSEVDKVLSRCRE